MKLKTIGLVCELWWEIENECIEDVMKLMVWEGHIYSGLWGFKNACGSER